MNPMLILFLPVLVMGDYWTDRAQFVWEENSQAIGAAIELTEKEKEVNDILMSYKLKEFDDSFADPSKFLPSIHFFQSKRDIENSEVFKFIQKLPKGASLHSHDTALVSLDFVYNLTYSENLYGCVIAGRLKLKFFGTPNNTECDWKLISDMRADNETFDAFLKSQLSIIVDNPEQVFPNINVVWAEFMEVFGTVTSMLCYKPIWQAYFYQALQELYEDNVMYIEFRSTLPQVYELDGTTHSPEEVVEFYIEVLNLFKEHYPDFHGARLIYAPSRHVNDQTVDQYMATARNLRARYPEFVAGFDLVGQEDLGKPLTDFIPQLLSISKEIKFFFHAAETDWNGSPSDLNLVDAILLNTTRIGHGYGVVKHPRVSQSLKDKKIALEISPISNQVLKLVDDLRNHPGSYLFANGFPVVICCDDPTFWGAKALSYDWYMAFMGFSPRNGDLKVLKQLAMNSLQYSAMDDAEKVVAMNEWQQQWDAFLDNILELSKLKHYRDFYSVDQI